MSGAVFDDQALVLRLEGMMLSPGRSLALMRVLGQALVRTTQDRFRTSTDPSGRPWHALNPAYAEFKRGPSILVESGARGGLLGSIHFQAGVRQVVVGTDKVYGAIHQFGGTIRPKTKKALMFRLGPRLVMAKSVFIPARPYLGFGYKDIAAVEEAAFTWLASHR